MPCAVLAETDSLEVSMIAVRTIQDVVAGTVTVDLPPHFISKRVEVIVLPVEESNGAARLRQLLLAAPTLSEDDLQRFAEVREWMNQWNVNESLRLLNPADL